MTGSRLKPWHADTLYIVTVAQVDLQVYVALNLMVIPLPQPSECKSYRHEPPHSCAQRLVSGALTQED